MKENDRYINAELYGYEKPREEITSDDLAPMIKKLIEVVMANESGKPITVRMEIST